MFDGLLHIIAIRRKTIGQVVVPVPPFTCSGVIPGPESHGCERATADAASVGKAVGIRRRSLGGEPETVAKIIGALEAAGVELLDDSHPCVRVRPAKPRGRAKWAAKAARQNRSHRGDSNDESNGRRSIRNENDSIFLGVIY